MQLRQGATIALGTQVRMQVLWPTSPLHKSSMEEQDNGLIIRLLAPGLRMLLIGADALSKYALEGLLASIDRDYLATDVVQIVGEAGKTFPTELQAVLQAAHPSVLVISPAMLSAKLRKAGATTVLNSLQLLNGNWQIEQTAQAGTIEISSDGQVWSMNADA